MMADDDFRMSAKEAKSCMRLVFVVAAAVCVGVSSGWWLGGATFFSLSVLLSIGQKQGGK